MARGRWAPALAASPATLVLPAASQGPKGQGPNYFVNGDGEYRLLWVPVRIKNILIPANLRIQCFLERLNVPVGIKIYFLYSIRKIMIFVCMFCAISIEMKRITRYYNIEWLSGLITQNTHFHDAKLRDTQW